MNFSFNDQLKNLTKLRALFIFQRFRVSMTDCMLKKLLDILISLFLLFPAQF